MLRTLTAWLMTLGLLLSPLEANESLREWHGLQEPPPIASAARLFHLTAISTAQTLQKLRLELGKGFEVGATRRHFVVALPSGQKDQWTSRFEEIYDAFYLYFSVRGIKMRPPAEPLVVIVFPQREDFLRYAQQEGTSVGAGVLGYYSPRTNRVAMFDASKGQATDQNWTQNNDVLIHELAHQIAFNTGVHSRSGQTPRWVCEGLGTLFEAKGVWKSRSFSKLPDRYNRGRLENYRRFAAQEKGGLLSELVGSDRLFQTDPIKAYAYAWAWTFYLTETQPNRYSDYLQLTSTQAAQGGNTASDRMKDFLSVFGSRADVLEARFTRFMQALKDP